MQIVREIRLPVRTVDATTALRWQTVERKSWNRPDHGLARTPFQTIQVQWGSTSLCGQGQLWVSIWSALIRKDPFMLPMVQNTQVSSRLVQTFADQSEPPWPKTNLWHKSPKESDMSWHVKFIAPLWQCKLDRRSINKGKYATLVPGLTSKTALAREADFFKIPHLSFKQTKSRFNAWLHLSKLTKSIRYTRKPYRTNKTGLQIQELAQQQDILGKAKLLLSNKPFNKIQNVLT